MKKVVISQYRLLHYRTSFFERLRKACLDKNIDLQLLHGQASQRESIKKDEGYLDWANKVKNRFWEFGSRDLIWQPFPSVLHDADMVVLMQENRILSNYSFLLNRLWSSRKVAYWGHGVNFQSESPSGLREKWKHLLLNKVDWWFAYTEMTTDILKKAGYPNNQITCLNNAIDTSRFKEDLASITKDSLTKLRIKLKIHEDASIGLFCGSLYPEKRLDFLIESVDKIRQNSEKFHCLIIGDGPSMPFILEAASTRPWLHVLGIQKGIDKALYFRLADFMLNPGLVGLHVVDAFCAGLVMVTTKGALHSPEVCYLKDGVNGLMTVDDVNIYAARVTGLIDQPDELLKIQTAALADADIYTIENMVYRFADGIERCLAQK